MATKKSSDTDEDQGTSSGRRIGAGAVARTAVEQLAGLTGREIEGVVGVDRSDEGWRVEIDVVELRRTPASTDVLATFEVDIDDDGELMGYRRTRRFGRGSVSGDSR